MNDISFIFLKDGSLKYYFVSLRVNFNVNFNMQKKRLMGLLSLSKAK